MSGKNPAQPAISSAVLLAALITIFVFSLSFLADFSNGWVFYLSLFFSSFLLIAISYRMLYRRFIYNQLTEIYGTVYRLRNPGLPVPFKKEDADLTSEIRKLLNDWDAVSREEIDQLKQVENYRRDFLSNVSHELKTPIFSIQGYIHTLIDGGIEDPEINMLYLSKASKSTDRLISIVDDLESISRLEAGMLAVEERTFDLTDLAREAIESLELQSRDKKITFVIRDEKPHYVFADKDMIRQVLVNLFVNSLKYGRQDGQTEVRISEAGDLVTTVISDNGIGIESNHLKRLFERFYRVDKSRSREQGGTGLGLAIVKHIIEAHRQQITVESEFGKGTDFTFTLRKSK
jgi:two-component system phosphate regulon sensor histidine kinase PhoR